MADLSGHLNALRNEMDEIRARICAPKSNPNILDPAYGAWRRAMNAGLDILAAQSTLQDQPLTKASMCPAGDMPIAIDAETRSLNDCYLEHDAQREIVIDRRLTGEDWDTANVMSVRRTPVASAQIGLPEIGDMSTEVPSATPLAASD